jgi:hypothetical protein
MLRKFIPNLDLVVEYEPLEIQKGLTYKGMPIQILDHKEQVFRTKKKVWIALSFLLMKV